MNTKKDLVAHIKDKMPSVKMSSDEVPESEDDQVHPLPFDDHQMQFLQSNMMMPMGHEDVEPTMFMPGYGNQSAAAR